MVDPPLLLSQAPQIGRSAIPKQSPIELPRLARTRNQKEKKQKLHRVAHSERKLAQLASASRRIAGPYFIKKTDDPCLIAYWSLSLILEMEIQKVSLILPL
jgi:hypothetical protein